MPSPSARALTWVGEGARNDLASVGFGLLTRVDDSRWNETAAPRAQPAEAGPPRWEVVEADPDARPITKTKRIWSEGSRGSIGVNVVARFVNTAFLEKRMSGGREVTAGDFELYRLERLGAPVRGGQISRRRRHKSRSAGDVETCKIETGTNGRGF